MGVIPFPKSHGLCFGQDGLLQVIDPAQKILRKEKKKMCWELIGMISKILKSAEETSCFRVQELEPEIKSDPFLFSFPILW